LSYCLILQSSIARRNIPSFPTRRSSDLRGRIARRRRSHEQHSGGAGKQRAAGCHLFTTSRAVALCRRRDSLLQGTWQSPPHSRLDRKSTRLNSSHGSISYDVFCLKKKKE